MKKSGGRKIEGWEMGNGQGRGQAYKLCSNIKTALVWRQTDATLQRQWMLSLGARDVAMGLGGGRRLRERGQCHAQNSPRFRRFTILPQLVQGLPHNSCLSTFVFSWDNLRSWWKLEIIKPARGRAKIWADLRASDSAAQDLNHYTQRCPHLEHSEFMGSGGAHGTGYGKTPLRILICPLLSLLKYTNGQLKFIRYI